jgi:SAM-dependent MidA family methyltransferase
VEVGRFLLKHQVEKRIYFCHSCLLSFQDTIAKTVPNANLNAMKTLADVIRHEILAGGGVIPFARFMELALYCPNLGYYETKRDRVGRRGDFYTSVSVGDLFGQLLAFQFAEWLEKIKAHSGELKIIEAGAHDGQLAKDILSWLQANRAELFKEVEYIIIEPSASRQQWQQENLKSFKIKYLHEFDSTMRFNGIIFSNELLDAFPVRRLGWDKAKRKWFEWGVAAEGEQFVWAKIQNVPEGLPSFVLNLPAELLEVLPDNYTIETSPAAERWWQTAAKCLNSGKLLTLDYGMADDEFFSPARVNGTLRAFFQHRFADDILANPGEQDLTAHVNFSAMQRAGEDAGLKTEFFSIQAKFLTQILEKTVKDKNFGEWTATRTRQFQTLTHPEHLGRPFRVLVQSR